MFLWNITWLSPNHMALYPSSICSMIQEAMLVLLVICFILVSSLAYSLTLKMEVTCSSETSVDFQQTMQSYLSEDRILHNHRCKNLESYIPHVFTACCLSKVLTFTKTRRFRIKIQRLYQHSYCQKWSLNYFKVSKWDARIHNGCVSDQVWEWMGRGMKNMMQSFTYIR
jgi:hypothetical protein